MKLGIISWYSEQDFKMAQDKGLSALELCVNVEQNVDEFSGRVELIKSLSEKYNVGICSIGRWGSDRIDSKGNIIEEELQNSYKLIDAAAALGCENFVCGCNYVSELSYYENCTAAIKYFEKVIAYGKEKGVKISTYNCRWNNFVVDPIAWKVIHGYLKDLGIKFDPSHSIYDGGDYLKEMRDWGHRFNHVHIKGALRIENERFDDPPAGLDQVNWGAFMAILYAKKYNGYLSIEPHSENWQGELGQKGIDFTIKHIKNLMF